MEPIRVLHVVTYMGRGGLETMLMNYYRHIDRNKVQFDFLVHRDFEADYDQEILQLGGRIYHISRLIPWSRRYHSELSYFLHKHSEYKIIHVHQDCLSAVALKCAKECDIPVRIAHSHNCSQDKNLKYIIKRYYMKQIPDFATEYFACGKTAGEWMFSGQSFRVLKNAIDTKDYIYSEIIRETIRKALGIDNCTVIGHVGRFNPQKNHSFLIDIFNEYLKLDSEAKLLLVGDGPDVKAIQNKVEKFKIQDKVIFTGIRTDVNRLLQAMDVFVFPSLYEGLPVTMIEAQASGIPCVISNSISEECIVTDGLVIKRDIEDSPKVWAESIFNKINYVRKDCTAEICKARYDICREAKQLEEFYIQKAGV